MFCVEARRVHPMVSYRNEKHRNAALDLAVYGLLEAGAELAGCRVKQEEALAALDHGASKKWQELLEEARVAAPTTAGTKPAPPQQQPRRGA